MYYIEEQAKSSNVSSLFESCDAFERELSLFSHSPVTIHARVPKPSSSIIITKTNIHNIKNQNGTG